MIKTHSENILVNENHRKTFRQKYDDKYSPEFYQQNSEKAMVFTLVIYQRLSTILETSNKSVWSNIFSYVKVHIFSNFLQYNIQNKKHKCKKNFLRRK